MKRIYKVKYGVKYEITNLSTRKMRTEWFNSNEIKVLSTNGMTQAVNKAKKHALKEHFVTDDEVPKKRWKAVDFNPLECELLSEAEIG